MKPSQLVEVPLRTVMVRKGERYYYINCRCGHKDYSSSHVGARNRADQHNIKRHRSEWTVLDTTVKELRRVVSGTIRETETTTTATRT